jgi:hypothetical protein
LSFRARAAKLHTFLLGRLSTGAGSFANQITLELRDTGEDGQRV